jgi:hypothetical protein
MTKTEARDIIVTDVRVWARKAGKPATKSLVEERISELGGQGYVGTLKHAAANATTVLAVWREVIAIKRLTGE